MFENFFHAGLARLHRRGRSRTSREVAAAVPTVVDVFLDRPAILTPFVERRRRDRRRTTARTPRALLDVLIGARRAAGQAAVRPAVEHGRRRGEPPRRAVRHGRPAVPVRARPALRRLTRRPAAHEAATSATRCRGLWLRHPSPCSHRPRSSRWGGVERMGYASCLEAVAPADRDRDRRRAGGPLGRRRRGSRALLIMFEGGDPAAGRRAGQEFGAGCSGPPSARSSSASSCWSLSFGGLLLGRWVARMIVTVLQALSRSSGRSVPRGRRTSATPSASGRACSCRSSC